jgi:hypothetical protein
MAKGDEHRALEREFADAGIDVTAPGFCDSRAFINAEARDRELLLKYARYVRVRPYNVTYANRVRTRVPSVAEFLTAELARDGRLGACIDASAVALRFLEREGIWGFAVVGSLVVDFINPRGRRRILHHFVHPDNPAKAGHAWLCVPPYDVVDVTIQAQSGFTAGERTRLAPILAERASTDGNIALDELAEPELLEQFLAEHGRPGRLDDFVTEPLRAFWTRSPARVVATQSVRLKYIDCGINAGDGLPLEEMRNLVLSGRGPGELHAEFVARYPAN